MEDATMSSRTDEPHMRQYLKDMLASKSPDQPVEEVLTVFCERYGVSMRECKAIYGRLAAKGGIVEK
jgi:hypothetical protein